MTAFNDHTTSSTYVGGAIVFRWATLLLALVVGTVSYVSADTVEVRITSTADDAEEDAGGDPKLYNNPIELGQMTWVALRFQNTGIPQGETIISAHLEFMASNSNSVSTDLTIFGEDHDDPSGFSTSSTDISGRTRTSASVAWSSVESWSSYDTYSSPDITAIIQEIVDRPGFASDEIVILIRSDDLNGQRRFRPRDSTSSYAPLLHVQYGAPQTYYVRPDGNNSNSGTGSSAAEAWASVTHAVDENLDPGDIVHVMAGTYTGEITPSIDGTSSQPIQFIADRTGAIFGSGGDVVLQASTADEALDFYQSDYLEFVGFIIRGDPTFNYEPIDLYISDGVVFKQCTITGSEIDGVYLYHSSATFINCLIYDNDSHGIEVSGNTSVLNVWNCTIADNGSDGIYSTSGTVTVTNSIIAFNNDDGLDDNGGTFNHTYNIVYGNGGSNFEGTSQGTGDLVSDPQFTNAASFDFTLQTTSPAINAGTSASGTVDVDYDDVPRPIGSTWDIGVYELPLLGVWEFEEGSGSTSADSSGNGKTASLEGSTSWEAGRCGQTIKLNGSSDWVDLGQFDLGTTAYSFCGWFKTTSGSQQTLFAATATGTTDHTTLVQLNSTGNVTFTHRYPAASSGGTTVTSGTTFKDGDWHFVAAVKTTTELRLYVDGELVNSASDTTAVHSSVDVVLGRESVSSSSEYFNGSMDEVSLYGAALSDSSIAAMVSLVAHWRLDDTTGTSATDSSVNARHATLSGTTFDSSSYSPGQIDDALQLDGSNDYLDSNIASNLATQVTMMMWFRSDDAGSISDNYVPQRLITQHRTSTGSRLAMGLNDNKVAVIWRTSFDRVQEGTSIPTAGKWYHAAVTFDGSYVRLYVDGVEEGSWSASSMADPSSHDFDIACQYGGYRHFDGVIDDIRIYDRALCADEIEDIYKSGKLTGIRIVKWVETE